ncbi:hypothetical protein CsSME_00029873 [Camellia sinensis var. sinensis]
MVEFASRVKEIALNLENENVEIVVFGSDTAIKEGNHVNCTGSIVESTRLIYSNCQGMEFISPYKLALWQPQKTYHLHS